ncbi:hypothetical protein BBJ28_00026254, partial [Nothophytophthora sp. Chile5]
HVKHVRESLSQNDHIVLLGCHDDDVDQLPVFSFVIRFGDRFLHHNFVCALLNDLFGIQTRGGCQCAGPYGARLLGLSPGHIAALGDAVAAKNEVLKPGVVRMSFPYFVDDDEMEYILEAVNFVASHGWKFLPQYAFDDHTSAWHHISRVSSVKLSLIHMRLRSSKTTSLSTSPEPIHDVAAHRRENLTQAAKLAAACIQKAVSSDSEGQKLAKSDEWLQVEESDEADPTLSSNSNPFTSTATSSIDLEADRMDTNDKEEAATLLDADADIALIESFEKEFNPTLSSSSFDTITTSVEAADNVVDERLLQDIADNMIGRNIPFESPFGVKAQCYADYTASGKAIESIEQF